MQPSVGVAWGSLVPLESNGNHESSRRMSAPHERAVLGYTSPKCDYKWELSWL
jgi:hypothetical protein